MFGLYLSSVPGIKAMKILFNPNLSLSLFSKRTGWVIGTPFKNIVLLLLPSKSLF